MKMQEDFEILRKNHVDVFPFQTKYFENGKTLVGAPWGKINLVYSIANSNWGDKVYYGQTNYDAIVYLSRFLTVESPANTGLPALPQGIRMEETSTDLYSGGISMRARTGLWANHNKKIWVFPWLQSNESLVIEWDGNKAKWSDDDAVDDVYWHARVQGLVKLHVEREHEFRFGDPRRVLLLENEIGTERAQLLLEERENTWLQSQSQSSLLKSGYIPSSAQTTAQAVPVITDSITFAQIADSGDNGANQDLVAALLEANLQDFLIIAGDVSYGDPYADVVTAKYPSFSIVKPSRGNHDYDINNGADYEAFFTDLENNGVTHEYVIGPAHFIFVPSDPREATLGYIDATTSVENGPIGQYIKAKFLLSPAVWKFLVFHHASYSSGSSHGNSLWMDMDFDAMGLSGKIDGIFMGHNHNFEVAIKNGYRYITNGLGGRPKNGFGAPVAGSVFRYDTDYGALFNSVTPTTWHYEFKNTAGTVVYEEDVSK